MGSGRSRQCLGSNRYGESEIKTGSRLGPPDDGRPALVAAIDVGGTIVEAGGDKLTRQGKDLALDLVDREARILLYSFDDDARVAAPLLEALGVGTFIPESYIIARHHSPEEIWAFPMTADKRSKYIDWEADKPSVLESLENPGDMQAATEESLGPDPDMHRFTSQATFRCFVDEMLDRGHVIFRAMHDPQHEYFRSRVGAADRRPRLKALAATARMVVGFDDSPADWEILGGNGKVLRAVTPDTAAARKGGPLAAEATNFTQELLRLEDDLADELAIARGERPRKKKGGSTKGVKV